MNCPRFPPKPKRNMWGFPSAPVLHTAARTGPLFRPDLRELGQIEITVQSHQVSPWKWESFFVRIYRGALLPEEDDKPHIRELVWPCFDFETPESKGEVVPFSLPSIGQRSVIDKSHEIWNYFQPGDQLEVAEREETWDFPQTKAFEVTVCVRNRWEPTPAMLALA
ncbi:hypothetical protein FRC12_003555 [Ceratobasidium sp. 428]|nr:hypothetical protein FRC12_003555 [Ceratobasidium sp. 428]